MNNFFEEHQSQRRLFPWLVVATVWVLSFNYIYINGFSKKSWFVDVFILILFPIITTLLLFFLKLSIKVDKNYFMFKMYPFHRYYKKIKLTDISSATIKEYNSGRLIHGWGISIPWQRNYKSYTVKGYFGVEITLKNGKKIFIGTQHPESLIANLNIE